MLGTLDEQMDYTTPNMIARSLDATFQFQSWPAVPPEVVVCSDQIRLGEGLLGRQQPPHALAGRLERGERLIQDRVRQIDAARSLPLGDLGREHRVTSERPLIGVRGAQGVARCDGEVPAGSRAGPASP